jgi:antirestriction protein
MHEQEPTPSLAEQDVRGPGETIRQTRPRIYVASLSDYNNGILHGTWIDATSDIDTMQDDVAEMLRISPTAHRYGDPAEEWAIHDYEGFGELQLSEVDSIEYIARIASGIERHGLAFAAWASEINSDPEQLDQFEERFQGEWESVEAYAENLLEEMGAPKVIDEAPEWLQPYLDLNVASFARDLEAGGDITTAATDDGHVWVWTAW